MKKSNIYLLSPLKKEETLSLPMISFSLIDKAIDFSVCDTLMFTSKQAVVSADKLDKSWKNYPSIAIGKATKQKIEELGGTVLYTPKEFYGEALSKDIQKYFSDKRVLYLRPKVVSFDSKAYLSNGGIQLNEQVIYETSCVKYLKMDKPKKNAIIIFTSPSTIKCFFENFEWDISYIAVLIGKATQEHLPKECKFVVSNEPLINSCIEKALEIEKNRANS
ncbi:Uroporphyrinogen-III synthase [hydrothermal vent metagenome]|uniref:uroporphyrinogen-III synthase n=1 Tax=hydrothermal vent metagenome TaxID=652676 RepID=A0A1W1C365_9ZZZZ